MKQLLQNMGKGETFIKTAPAPKLSPGMVLIQTTTTLISAGTEKMLVGFGKASYLEKARQQPEKVKQVLAKIKTDGLAATLDSVRSKLAQPLPLGYCHVGIVDAVGADVHEFKPGDRVISNGPHADLVRVAKNLCAKIPDGVDDESAAFTVAASIGLQGIRLSQPTIGERFVVIGVGLIGLLTVQLLKANGCQVLAIDFDDQKLALAERWGAQICNPLLGADPIAAGMAMSEGHGVDGVIITASTQSNDPITQAAQMSRQRGRIILVGVTGLQLNRADFYEKELSFQVSCSYGPGRYAAEYEEQGLDYPIGFVRWTEQRNFEAVLQLMAEGQLDVKPLISHRYLFEDALAAYDTLMEDKTALGILLQYTSKVSERYVDTVCLKPTVTYKKDSAIISVIGAGNYASRVLIPALKQSGADFGTLVTTGGPNSVIQGEKGGFTHASTDVDAVFADPHTNTLVIATRHDSHAALVVKALNAGKHVFVEKPLALTLDELSAIEAAYHTQAMQGNACHLMVGFNRRFSPQIQKMKSLLSQVPNPKTLIMTVNAGFIPADHWVQDQIIGGGRIIGEACHFIDLMRFLAGSKIKTMQCMQMGMHPAEQTVEDKAVITLGFEDGSFGTIHYLANGAASFPKERIEVFTAGRVFQLDNFRRLTGFGWPKFKRMHLWKQDKGQVECCQRFLTAIKTGTPTPIAFEEIIEVARVTIMAANQMKTSVESACAID